jgi:hypothetical protein
MINNLCILFSCAMVIYVVLRAVTLDRRETNERKARQHKGVFSQ